MGILNLFIFLGAIALLVMALRPTRPLGCPGSSMHVCFAMCLCLCAAGWGCAGVICVRAGVPLEGSTWLFLAGLWLWPVAIYLWSRRLALAVLPFAVWLGVLWEPVVSMLDLANARKVNAVFVAGRLGLPLFVLRFGVASPNEEIVTRYFGKRTSAWFLPEMPFAARDGNEGGGGKVDAVP